jgi:DNA-binding PadR family transcriptional regulator
MYRHPHPDHHPSDRRRSFGPRGGEYMGWWAGPAFPGPRGGRARRGDVRDAILSLLAEGPSNGYGLITAIQDRTAGSWRPSPGSVYPTLQQLVDQGLIAAVGDGQRPEYALTDEGRTYLDAHAEELSAAWERSRNPWREQRDLVQAAGKLASVVRQVAAEGTPEQRTAAASKLDDLRRDLYRMLGE